MSANRDSTRPALHEADAPGNGVALVNLEHPRHQRSRRHDRAMSWHLNLGLPNTAGILIKGRQ